MCVDLDLEVELLPCLCVGFSVSLPLGQGLGLVRLAAKKLRLFLHHLCLSLCKWNSGTRRRVGIE